MPSCGPISGRRGAISSGGDWAGIAAAGVEERIMAKSASCRRRRSRSSRCWASSIARRGRHSRVTEFLLLCLLLAVCRPLRVALGAMFGLRWR
jgi:hypothetical protein